MRGWNRFLKKENSSIQNVKTDANGLPTSQSSFPSHRLSKRGSALYLDLNRDSVKVIHPGRCTGCHKKLSENGKWRKCTIFALEDSRVIIIPIKEALKIMKVCYI